MAKQTTQASALKLIEQAAEESWKDLDLSGMGLSQLPSAIGQCKKSKRLTLSKLDRKRGKIVTNPIPELPSEIGQLEELESLDLYSTQIADLPECVTQLTNLRSPYLIRLR